MKLKFKHTNRTLYEVGKMLKTGLQKELKNQQHVATGKLINGLKYHVNKKESILRMFSPVKYWRTVSNPKFFKSVSLRAILKWVRIKGFARGNEESAAQRIWYRMMVKPFKNAYGKPYVMWTDGNSLRRMNFEKFVALEYKKKVAEKVAPSIGVDVANMIAKQIRKNNPKTNVVEAF